MKSFFTPKDVMTVVGISYRQMQYWDKTNFIKPSYRRKGKYRLYTFCDLIQFKLAAFLRERDFSIQHLRKINKSLRHLMEQITFPLVEMTILVDKSNLMVLSGELLMNPFSKLHFIYFEVGDLRDDVDACFPPVAEEMEEAVH